MTCIDERYSDNENYLFIIKSIYFSDAVKLTQKDLDGWTQLEGLSRALFSQRKYCH